MLTVWQEAVQSTAHQLANSRPPEWWEVITGILAIPATLLGLAYSYALVKKTQHEIPKVRAETEKLELEIREKKEHLSPDAAVRAENFLQAAIQPIVDFRRWQLLLLRLIVLFLLLTVWPLVERTVFLLVAGGAAGFGKLFHMDLEDPLRWYGYCIYLLATSPKLGYWIVLYLAGWPLLRDVSSLAGISFGDVLRLRIPKE